MKIKKLLLLFIFLSLSFTGCSSDDAVPCGETTCGSSEVCEDGKCVLGLFIEGGSIEEEEIECQNDEDCPAEKICTETDSEPGSSCIPRLPCDLDADCQSGLQCGKDSLCR